VQLFLCLCGELAITNDVDHALDTFIIPFWCHCRLPFDGDTPAAQPRQYRASVRVPLDVFLQTLHLSALKNPRNIRATPPRLLGLGRYL
jgi:hypothetical protein